MSTGAGQSLVAKKRDPKKGFGTLGTKIQLSANHYKLKCPTQGHFYHYDVDMVYSKEHKGEGDAKPAVEKGKGRGKPPGLGGPAGTAAPKLPKAIKKRAMEIFKKMPENTNFLNKTMPAYDGEKSLYTSKELKIQPELGSYSVIVTLPKDEEGGEKKVKVTVQPCQPLQIAWSELEAAVQGRTQAVPIVILQCVNTVFREAALATATNIAIRRSYFNRALQQPIDMGQGREIWAGFYSSARLTQWKVTLNLDKSNTVFYKRIPLLPFLADLLNSSPASLNPVQRKTFEKEIKTLKVETKHGGGVRRVRVTGVTAESPDKLFFEADGKRTSVLDYFKNTYKIVLQQTGLPCLKVGTKGNYLPIELCTLVEQKCDRRMTPDQTANMVRACTQTANQRKMAVKNIRDKIVKYDTDPTLKEFGISVDKDMVKVDGRHLDAPLLSAKDKTVAPKKHDGTYDPRNIKFADAASLKNWVVLRLAQRSDNLVGPFVESLVQMGRAKGMDIEYPDDSMLGKYNPRNPDFADIFRQTQENFKKQNRKLDLILIAIEQDFHYPEIKKAGDIVVGVTTQVVKGATLFKNTGPKLAQLVGNVLLKVNAKLGGTNVQVANFDTKLHPDKARMLLRFVEKPTIVFGADVTHPSPGEAKTTPSIAAVVASYNRYFTSYSARVRAQGHRDEIMTDLEEMVRELLVEFKVRVGKEPHRIIFYRDGVSEGQFEQVMLLELNAIQAACRKLGVGYEPQITYIIVGKRHHTRFFCENKQQEVGKGENIPAGTVVDTGIVHFSEMDYFLCSHGGIQGTSRPAHYNVLYDDADYSADEIELFSYYLTYCYARCNRSVSIPAPAYYAHHVAFRARHHLNDIDESDTASSVSGPEGGPSPRIKQLNEKIKMHDNLGLVDKSNMRTMYFV